MANNQDLILAELREISQSLQEVNEDVSILKCNQERHEKMITQLLQIVGATNAKVVQLEKRADKLEEIVVDLAKNTNKITEKFEKQDELIQLLTARSIQQGHDIRELQRHKSA